MENQLIWIRDDKVLLEIHHGDAFVRTRRHDYGDIVSYVETNRPRYKLFLFSDEDEQGKSSVLSAFVSANEMETLIEAVAQEKKRFEMTVKRAEEELASISNEIVQTKNQ